MGHLSYPIDVREPRRADGRTETRHLNDLVESTDVNAGGRPAEASSRPTKQGRRRRCHSSRGPGKPATGRRAPGGRRATRRLTGADLKWEALKAKAEWLTNRGVTPGKECRPLESRMR